MLYPGDSQKMTSLIQCQGHGQKKISGLLYLLLFLVHRSLIKNRTQTAVIDILFECSHFYKLDISYAIQHIFSKVILKKMTRLYIQIYKSSGNEIKNLKILKSNE